MAHSVAVQEFEALTKAFSGFGVDEKSIITLTAKWHPDHRQSFRKSCPQFFRADERFFEKWEDQHIILLEREFSRFKLEESTHVCDSLNRVTEWLSETNPEFQLLDAGAFRCIWPLWSQSGQDFGLCEPGNSIFHETTRIQAINQNAAVLWAMHPWERDARLAYDVVHKGQPSGILIEIACTRSSEELLGARRAYHSLFHHSIEEDVAYVARGSNRSLLVALVSSFRYEGSWVNAEIAKSEAKILGKAIKEAGTKKLLDNEDVIRILSTRSKLQLNATFGCYKEIFGEPIEKDLKDELSLLETVLCLSSAATYFSRILDSALKEDASEILKESLTRVIVTRADIDIKEIKEEYQKQYGVPLGNKIKEATNGNYKDFLLAALERSK